MKVAYITADFGVPVFEFEGASIHVREMIAALRRLGHHLLVLSPALHRSAGDEIEWAIHQPFEEADDLVYFPLPQAAVHADFLAELVKLEVLLGWKPRIRQELRDLLFNLEIHDRALAPIEDHQADFIYERYSLFSFAGIRLAKRLGIPHLLEVNAPLAAEQQTMYGLEMKELARKMECQILQETDHVLVVSEELKEFAISCGVSPAKIFVMPNGVNPRRFELAVDDISVRAEYGLADKTVIGFVGSLKQWHGTDDLIEAFHELSSKREDVHLMLVGDGPMRGQLEASVAEKKLDKCVTFTGKVSYNAIPAYIAAMDIAVAPYLASERFYFSPIKLFEYMIMAKPVVAANIGQVREIIKHGETGLSYAPGEIAQLVTRLERLMNDEKLCLHLGQNAQKWVREQRNWDGNAARVVEIAQKVIL